MLLELVKSTLISMGINIIDIGLSTTPTTQIIVQKKKAEGGIILTASHNPKNWNALKLFNSKGEFLIGEEAEEMFRKAVDEEKDWAQYLFKDGTMIGLNDKLLVKYVEWIANKRMRAIGLDPIYDAPIKNNPLPWTEHWISSKGLQVAPQETEVESYVVGGIKQDVKKDTFSGFKL